MTFNVFIADYFLILAVMALVLFIANEVVKLHDAVRIAFVTYKVRRLATLRSQQQWKEPPAAAEVAPIKKSEKPVWKAKPRQDTREWNAPTFSVWKWVGIAAGSVTLIAVLTIAYGIITYKP